MQYLSPIRMVMPTFSDYACLEYRRDKVVSWHYPKAVLVPDNYNFLPLHHAIELDVPLEIIQVLLSTEKECARSLMSGDGGKLPLHFAIEMRRSQPVLQALISAYPGLPHPRWRRGDCRYARAMGALCL